MAHWSSVWNGFKEQRPPNSFQRNSGAFAVDPIGPSASVLWRSGSVMISVICGGSPKFDAPQVRPAFQKKLQQERSSTIIKPSSHHQSEFVFLGYVYAFSKPCWTSDTGCSCARIISKSLKKWKHPVNPERRQVASWQNPGRGWGWYPSN